MKKLFLTMGLIVLTTIGWGQETIKRSDLYQDPTTYLLSQFIIEVEGKTASELKNSVELWAASIFNYADKVTIANGENYIVYKPLVTFHYNAGLGVYVENKMYLHTKFEFKDGSIRVTITEHEAIYTGQYGPVSRCTWPSHVGKREVPSEVENTGTWKAAYRCYTQAINEKNNWVNQIKNINFSPENSGW